MNIVSIAEALDTLELEAPSINALAPNADNYSIAMFQPIGVLEADVEGVRNADKALAEKQFDGFLAKALECNAELVVTPEYSLPWSVLIGKLEASNTPPEGCLWILGCESIKVSQLDDLKVKVSAYAEFVCEDCENHDLSKFYSPLVYVFRTKTKEDKESKLVVAVQFKTCPMSDQDHFERNGMQKGSTVYKFGAEEPSISLVSLLCADSFSFTDEHVTELYSRSLIFHLQLNPNPRQNKFKKYRENVMELNSQDVEIICLNWASDVTMRVNDKEEEWNNISGTAWYLRPDRFDTRDQVLNDNHKLGLYYTWSCYSHCHSLFFNYRPSVFFLKASKVYHHAVPAVTSKRTGPKLTKNFQWNSSSEIWEESAEIEDGFDQVVDDVKDVPESILLHAKSDPITTERLLAISSGKIVANSNWYKVEEIDACIIENDEVVKRVTFAQDRIDAACSFRNSRLSRVKYLEQIVSNVANLPKAISDFEKGFEFAWSEKNPHQNAKSMEGNLATIVYLGEESTEGDRDKVKKMLAQRLHESSATNEASIHAKQRLIVWYRNADGKITVYKPDEYIQFDNPNNRSAVDLAREG